MAWSFVCPASRGIGFHLTRHLLQTTKIPVVATARKDVASVKKGILEDLKGVEADRLTVLEVDVTGKLLCWKSILEIGRLIKICADEDTIAAAAEETKQLFPENSHHLHLAFAIPGILYPEKSPSQLDHSQLTQYFDLLLLLPNSNNLLIRYTEPSQSTPSGPSYSQNTSLPSSPKNPPLSPLPPLTSHHKQSGSTCPRA